MIPEGCHLQTDTMFSKMKLLHDNNNINQEEMRPVLLDKLPHVKSHNRQGPQLMGLFVLSIYKKLCFCCFIFFYFFHLGMSLFCCHKSAAVGHLNI